MGSSHTQKKIYISGKISGIEKDAVEIFAKAEIKLQDMGYQTVNPMRLPHDHDKSWQSYMREDILALCGCDAIYMLSNWKDSKGASIEHSLAIDLGMPIIYESLQTGI